MSNPINAGDFKAALDLLTKEELAHPIVTVVNDTDEYLTITVSNSFDKPLVKLLSSAKGKERINIVRI